MGGKYMKSNIIKYIFILVVIGLVGYSAYLLYGRQEEMVQNPIQETKTTQADIITNIRVPIVGFDTINPILSKNQQIQDLARLVYEPLLNVSKDGKIQLCLAKEWSKTSATSYVIKLKENVKWQDGNKLTAKDVQYTMDRLKDTNVSTIYAYNVKDVIGVEVIDDTTIKINLGQEVPFFEYNLTFPIMSHIYYENEDFVNTSKNNNPVGTGRFKAVNDNGNMMLKQNQNWWNLENDATKLTQIQLVKFENMGEVYNAFKIGNIDLLTTQTISLEDYIGTIGYQKKEYLGRNFDYVSFNCDNKILSDPQVRKAISYLMDKENIVSGIYKGKYRICNFPLDNGNYVYDASIIGNEYNQEKAKETLTNAGWVMSKNTWQKTENYRTTKLRLDLVVNDSNGKRVEVADNIANNLRSFGIDVTVKKVSDSQYKSYLEKRNYDMILTGVYTGYSPDLSSYFGDANLANFQNEEIKRLIQEIKEIQDEKILKEKYQRICEIYKEQMPYVFLYLNQNTLAYSTKLLGEIDPYSYDVYQGIGTWYRQ